MFSAQNEKNASTQDQKQNIKQAARTVRNESEKLADKTLHQLAENAGSKVRELADRGAKQAEHLKEEAEARITHNPFKAVGIAALAGVFAGLILRRNRK